MNDDIEDAAITNQGPLLGRHWYRRYLGVMQREISASTKLAIFLLALVGTIAAPSALMAQGTTELRVRLEAAPGQPLARALVAVLDEADRVVAEGLSTRIGTNVLRVPPGTYRVQVRRIGFRPFTSEPVTMPRSEELVLLVETPRVVLDAMVVSASAQCGRIGPDAQTLAAVWEEITKALRSSQLTLADISEIAGAEKYRRQIGPGGEVVSADTMIWAVVNTRPFGAPDPQKLIVEGYVRGDEARGWDYSGPDEAVLLSDEFAATHCFRVVRDKNRRGEIGVAFEPAPRRRQSDIKGVLWLNAATSELREVRFRYVNAGVLTRFEPGGFTRFQRMPSGAWLVSEWQLQMPILELRALDMVVIGRWEDGGRIIPVPATGAKR